MAEELKDLIEKIQEDGVRVAEDKAKSIEEEARHRSEAIVKKAREEAEKLISEAKDEVRRMEESGKESLKQAARDLLLSLKKEINATLDRIIVSNIQAALVPTELGRIIAELVEGAKEKKEIVISVKEGDLKKLEKFLFSELKKETKKGITLKSSEDIRGGFIISYDKGKSHYDFTDKAIAEYIASQLKPKLADMLNRKK